MTAHTVLSLKYVRRHYELLRSDPRLAFAVTQLPDWFSRGVEEAVAHLGVPVVPIEAAREQDWDLILFGTHGTSFFKPDIPKVHIQHGLGAGKVVDGQGCFTYGPRWVLQDGAPRYAAMLESSYATRARALTMCPELDGRIAVVGDLFCDDLLAARSRRDELRVAFGLAPEDIAVLVMSTWGPHGVLESLGMPLLLQLLDLPARYKVLLTMHDHLWFGREGEDASWPGQIQALAGERFRARPPGEDWVPYLTAADVAIVDHTSLALYYSLLQRPAIATPVPPGVTTEGALISRFRSTCWPLRKGQPLEQAIGGAIRHYDSARFAPYLREVTSYPGAAGERTTTLLRRLLGRSY